MEENKDQHVPNLLQRLSNSPGKSAAATSSRSSGTFAMQQLSHGHAMLRSLKDERYFKKLGKNQNHAPPFAHTGSGADSLDDKIAVLDQEWSQFKEKSPIDEDYLGSPFSDEISQLQQFPSIQTQLPAPPLPERG